MDDLLIRHQRIGQVLTAAFPLDHPILSDWALIGIALKAQTGSLTTAVEQALKHLEHQQPSQEDSKEQ